MPRLAPSTSRAATTQRQLPLLRSRDPGAQLRAMDTLKPTWVTTPPDATKAPPGDTAPKGAPPPGSTTPTVDHKQVLKSLEANPFAHAAYSQAHAKELYPEQRA